MTDSYSVEAHRKFTPEQNAVPVASSLIARMDAELRKYGGTMSTEWVQASGQSGSVQRQTLDEAVMAAEEAGLAIERATHRSYMSVSGTRGSTQVGVILYLNDGWTSVYVNVSAPDKLLAEKLGAAAEMHLNKYQSQQASEGVLRRLALHRKLEELRQQSEAEAKRLEALYAAIKRAPPLAAAAAERKPNWWQRTWRDHTAAIVTTIIGTVIGGIILTVVLVVLGLAS